MLGGSHILTLHFLIASPVQVQAWFLLVVYGARALVHVAYHIHLVHGLALQVAQVAQPELLVEGTRYETPLEQHEHPLLVTLPDLVLQVVLPVLQLTTLQWLHVEVGPFDLKSRPIVFSFGFTRAF